MSGRKRLTFIEQLDAGSTINGQRQLSSPGVLHDSRENALTFFLV